VPAINSANIHAKLTHVRHPGTSGWLQSVSDFMSWILSPTSSCLCCFGIPGSGKSVLAVSVVESLLQSQSDTKSVTYFHYCDYSDAASLNPIQLATTLIKQLMIRLPLDPFNKTFSTRLENSSPYPRSRSHRNTLSTYSESSTMLIACLTALMN
jgi:hypothetical protein